MAKLRILNGKLEIAGASRITFESRTGTVRVEFNFLEVEVEHTVEVENLVLRAVSRPTRSATLANELRDEHKVIARSEEMRMEERRPGVVRRRAGRKASDYLEEVFRHIHRPATPVELAELITELTDFTTTSKTLPNTLRTAMEREPKRFKRMGDSAWGLVEFDEAATSGPPDDGTQELN